MQMNKKMLHLPPYLSTSWKNVSALFVEERGTKLILKVALTTGKEVEIPHLEKGEIEALFKAHAETLGEIDPSLPEGLTSFKLPINMGNMGDLMQHNSDQMHASPLPQAVLEKISEMAKAMGMTLEAFPKPEPHCNCPHCQIARAIHRDEPQITQTSEEEVSDEDLRFRDWDIVQTNEKLYLVTNPLNKEEHYNVFLGEPIGCTCGQKNCEHIRAVLSS